MLASTVVIIIIIIVVVVVVVIIIIIIYFLNISSFQINRRVRPNLCQLSPLPFSTLPLILFQLHHHGFLSRLSFNKWFLPSYLLKCYYDQILDIHFFTFSHTIGVSKISCQISIYYEQKEVLARALFLDCTIHLQSTVRISL